MKCPICGEEVNEAERFCLSCGADMMAFGEVAADKIIYNQTPQEQQAVGDDSVTQLIPENYMQAAGDDSVTQLIPENYMTAQGDDSVTQLIPENYMTAQGDDSVTQLIPENYMTAKGDDTSTVMITPSEQAAYTPNNQPVFNSTPNYAFNTNAAGEPNKKSSPWGIIFSVITVVVMLALLVVAIMYSRNPVFYIVDSYVGGSVDAEVIKQELLSGDMEEANSVFGIITTVSIVFFALGVVNALIGLIRLIKKAIKSPVASSIAALVLSSVGMAIFIFIRQFFEAVIKEEYADIYEKTDKFNLYDLHFILCIVAAVFLAVNIFTSIAARKSNYR